MLLLPISFPDVILSEPDFDAGHKDDEDNNDDDEAEWLTGRGRGAFVRRGRSLYCFGYVYIPKMPDENVNENPW